MKALQYVAACMALTLYVAAAAQPANRADARTLDYRLQARALAPGVWVVEGENADFSLVTPDNRARAGDIIVIYSTGLGQTTPAVETGALVVPPSGGFNNTSPVTVSIGGQNAEVVYSIASPGFAGLYQTAVRVPSGLTVSSAPLILRSGTTASNTVNIAIQ